MDALSNEEIENCRIAFNKFDKDMSGSISDAGSCEPCFAMYR